MFRFKQFAIAQDRSAMKVGTDGVLLGAWVELRGEEQRILDIGAGTGVIALMMAQRTQHYPTPSAIEAVEIDEQSAQQAVENIASSPWSNRVKLHQTSVQSFAEGAPQYDLIVSNPPFFVDSLLAPNSERSNARHTTLLSFADLAKCVVEMLSPEGRFALVLPTAEQQLFDTEALPRLELIRRCSVKGGVRNEAKRQLSEYRVRQNGAHEVQPTLETVVIRQADGQYSDEYRRLTREFYLKF
ncbi:MAG: methyltransferase [Rikenellaceae bacterium]